MSRVMAASAIPAQLKPRRPTASDLSHLHDGMVLHGRIRRLHAKKNWGVLISESCYMDIIWHFGE